MTTATSAYLNRPLRSLGDVRAGIRTGIYARTLLPVSTYDHLFALERGPHGECRCILRRDGAIVNRVPDYWEDVPAPEGWDGNRD